VRTCLLGFAALLGSCGSIGGEVRDASTGKPVAGALVKISTIGWGRRDGQLVWDAETIHEARADRHGRFHFSGIDGGGRLQVLSPAGGFDHGALCPREQLIWVGGPYAALRADRRLIFADTLEDGDRDRVHPPALAKELGVSTSDWTSDGEPVLRLEATGGVKFVAGTGAIPPPPAMPYSPSVEIDFRKDCGWIFVSDGAKPIAVIEARAPSGSQRPGQPWRWSMMFAPLPTVPNP
jgi:hypothetical protein